MSWRSSLTTGVRVVVAAAVVAGLALVAVPLRAQTSDHSSSPDLEAFRPNVQPAVAVPRASARITLDGQLDDAGWVGAARATGFSENFPREQGRPSVRSEAWITYDDDNLYIALIAYDDPRTIRASLRDRDQIWQDDYFGILLDTYGDASWAYFLFANPLGVQGDTRFATSSGEDDGFDIIFHTEAAVTDSGYQIEMAIPFASLRFPDRDVQTWKATFWRTRPRGARETHAWAAMSRNEPCFLCQFGTLTGIEGVKSGGALELLPAVVASHAGSLVDGGDPGAGFDNRVDGDVGMDVRYSFSGGLTAEGTLNPDFSQVESDVAQIDVNTTFALFFPERRPFFQEGSDLFNTNFDVVYTRQINNPLAATKLVGRMGRTTIAYLGAFDENSPVLLPFEERSYVGEAGKSVSNILRFRQTLLRDSYVGAILTDRRVLDGGSGSVGGVDGVFRFLNNYQFEYQLLGSYTVEPNDTALTAGLSGVTFDRGSHTAAYDGESFTGYAQYTSLERDARTWDFDFDYWASSPTFRADDGFETRNDYRRLTMWQGLNLYPSTRIVNQVQTGLFARRTWNFDGVEKGSIVEPSLYVSFIGQTSFNFWYDLARERFADVEFDGIQRWGGSINSSFSEPVRLGLFVSHGESIYRDRQNPLLGTGTDVEVWGTLKPHTRVVLEPSLTFSQLGAPDGSELFSGFIVRTRTNLQFTRELFLRLIVQYNDFSRGLDVEPLLTYKVNPFTLFFVGSSLAYQDYDRPIGMAQTSRQFFTKFQYLFRR